MPNLTSNLTNIRAGGHRVQGYVSVALGQTVATGTLTATPSDDYSTIAYTLSTGSLGVNDIDATIDFYSSGGTFKGSSRISREQTPTATSLAIRDTGSQHLKLVTGDTFTVRDERRIMPRLPSEDDTFSPDNEAYTDQTSSIAPICNSGGAIATWVDTGQTYATLNFYGDESYTVDEDSSGTLTHSWVFPSGSTPSTSTAANPTGVQIPVGTWNVRHTVTDTSNSKTATQHVPVCVHNTANPPMKVNVEAISGAVGVGWRMDFSPLNNETVTLASIPDNATIIFWVEESNGSYGSYYTGRSHVKFVGWLDADNCSENASDKTVTFSAIDAIGRMKKINGFGQVFLSDATPANWQEIEGLSVKRAFLHLLRNFTTATSVCDTLYTLDDLTYPAFFIQKKSPLSQLREIVDSLDGVFTSDRRGILQVYLDLDLVPLADRSSVITTLTLQSKDIIDIEIEREHPEAIDQLDIEGIVHNSDTPLFARYPANPNTGGISDKIDRLIITDQTSLNERGGRRGAKIERRFIDVNNINHNAFKVSLTLRGSYDVFDLYKEYVGLSYTNFRGVDLSAFSYVIDNIAIDYVDGTAETSLDLHVATNGNAASTYTPPTPDVPADVVVVPVDSVISQPPYITQDLDGYVVSVEPNNVTGANIRVGYGDGTFTSEDASAFLHEFEAGQIAGLTAKASPTSSDYLLIEDAAASNAKKRITIGDLPSGSSLTVEEEDGTPSVSTTTLKFPNGTLTDNGGGSVSYAPSGGGSSTPSFALIKTASVSVTSGSQGFFQYTSFDYNPDGIYSINANPFRINTSSLGLHRVSGWVTAGISSETGYVDFLNNSTDNFTGVTIPDRHIALNDANEIMRIDFSFFWTPNNVNDYIVIGVDNNLTSTHTFTLYELEIVRYT